MFRGNKQAAQNKPAAPNFCEVLLPEYEEIDEARPCTSGFKL